MNRIKRTINTLLGIAMLLVLLSTAALAAEPATQTADFINDSTGALAMLNAAKTGTENSTWDGSTLTLNGVNFTTTADTALKLPAGATIVLADGTENTITGGDATDGSYCYGIRALGDLTITIPDGATGNGKLIVNGGDAYYSYGIYASQFDGSTSNGAVTIQGGTVQATGGTANVISRGIYAGEGVTISGGTVTAKGGETTNYDSYGIAANTVTISGGTVEATGGTADWISSGIYADDVTISGGTVEAKGGAADEESYGIYATDGNVAISDTNGTANVTATGGTATGTDSDSYGIRAEKGDVTITGGTVEVTGGAAVHKSSGIYAKRYRTESGDYAGGNINISGGAKVTAKGGEVTSAKGLSYGLFANEVMTISGDATDATKVIANGGDATSADSESYGIRVYWGDVTISGSTTVVTATGGTAGNNSYGIGADAGDVTISGSAEVTATGGTATGAYSNSYGIIAISYYNSESDFGGGNVNISTTANVIATGGTAVKFSYGICAVGDSVDGQHVNGNVTISGGTVTAKGGDRDTASYGIDADGNLTISGGTVQATGGTASSVSSGIRVYYGDVTISGSTTKVTATGGAANGASCDSHGIYAFLGSVKIEGGEVTATGGTASGSYSTGISAEKDVTISGGTVTATGSAASGFSYGISAGKVATISGSAAVTAEGGTTSSESYGIATYNGSIKITITDGAVIAKAASATKASALSKTPAALPTAYQWRISNSGDYSAYPGSAYTWNAADTYVEIRNVLRTVVTVTGSITANDKTYDGTTAATLNFGFVTLTGVASGDIVSLDTDNVTATFDNKNVGTGKPVTVSGLDLRGEDAYKYVLTQPDLTGLTASIIACTNIADTTETAQTVYVGEGSSFRAPTFTGAGGEAATGDVTYTLSGANKTIDEIIAHLNTLTAGETASVDYSFAGTGNYAGASASGTITVTVTSRPAPVIPIVTTYPVTAAQPENGAVTVSPANAAAGVTVTVTVKPDAGHELASLTVTDAGGKGITLTDKGDGKYTFTMPASNVTVSAAFSRVALPFTDVPADAYYYDAVAWAVENGITTGTGDGTTFSPNAPCTRGQIVTFLWRAAGCPEPKSSVNPFTDVEEGAYYSKAVLWAVENGITTGTGDGTTFSPDAPCTRDQTVTFLWRAVEKPAATVGQSFTDVPADAYYASAVQWAVANGVTTGTGNGMFSPDATCTRAQIVTFLYRCLGDK